MDIEKIKAGHHYMLVYTYPTAPMKPARELDELAEHFELTVLGMADGSGACKILIRLEEKIEQRNVGYSKPPTPTP